MSAVVTRLPGEVRPLPASPGNPPALVAGGPPEAAAEPPALLPPRVASEADLEVCRRCAFLLLGRGHVPGVKLDHVAWRLLLFLIGQGPGYAARRRTLAKKLDTNETSIKVALARLRAVEVQPGVPLLRSEVKVPLNGKLPWRPTTRATANLHGYDVSTSELLPWLRDADRRERAEAQAERAAVGTARKLGLKSVRTSGSNPDRTLNGSMDGLIATPSSPSPTTTEAQAPAATSQAVKNSAGPEIRSIAHAWAAIQLGPALGTRELRTLAKRARDGCSLDELRDAVRGATHPEQEREAR